jgi:hypothetical protein
MGDSFKFPMPFLLRSLGLQLPDFVYCLYIYLLADTTALLDSLTATFIQCSPSAKLIRHLSRRSGAVSKVWRIASATAVVETGLRAESYVKL